MNKIITLLNIGKTLVLTGYCLAFFAFIIEPNMYLLAFLLCPVWLPVLLFIGGFIFYFIRGRWQRYNHYKAIRLGLEIQKEQNEIAKEL